MATKVQNLLATFFKVVYGRHEGKVCLARIDRNSTGKGYSERFFDYPAQLEEMADYVEACSRTHDTYYCPQLFSRAVRSKDNVCFAPTVFADLDACPPDKLKIDPSVVINSSPGRWQALWVLDDDYPPLEVESAAKRLAYGHKSEGCDTSGWDLTQLLRVPFTFNHKYTDQLQLPSVTIEKITKQQHKLSDFSIYPTVDKFDKILAIPMPIDLGMGKEFMDRYASMLPKAAMDYYKYRPVGSWSDALWSLETMLAEAGVPPEEIFSIAKSAACNKYARDNRPDEHLWTEILKAVVHTTTISVEQRDLQDKSPLLSDEERLILKKTPANFVDKYIKWASNISDAARQYHQAGAFVILSALCSGSVKLPTSFGTIYPNMWFMILGDTTVTRKSTSMDTAIELLEEVNDDAVVATDGSVEGLMTSMAQRSGKPSVFLRDEFSGLIEAMIKKDYMAGAAEFFTKLYDCKRQTRVLKKETIDIRDPRLIMFTGGIKTKITDTLREEHVSSGFMPRFVFITAVSDVTKIRPIGPPTKKTISGREALIADMMAINKRYNDLIPMVVNGVPQPVMQRPEFEAFMDQAVWDRYNQLERQMVKLGIDSDRRELMTPVGDRLAKSILKAAVLLACDRERYLGAGAQSIEVKMEDLLSAIKYGEHWLKFAYEVISNVGNSEEERRIVKVYEYIANSPGGVSKSQIMGVFKLKSNDMHWIARTLVDRAMIQQTAAGGVIKYSKA